MVNKYILHQSTMFAKRGETLGQRLTIQIIPNSAADQIVKRYHYLHRKRTGGLQLSHGIFFDGIMSGCFVWASPTFHRFRDLIPPLHQKEVVELARMWLNDSLPKNAETASLSRAIKSLMNDWECYCGYKAKAVVSYSDLAVGHKGVIYKAANFEDWGFAKAARHPDIEKGYSRNRERWATGRYTAKGTEVAPRSSNTKRMWVYFMDSEVKALCSKVRSEK